MFSKFYDLNETKKRFLASMPDTNFPITYDEWLQVPKDKKAVALYLSFYIIILSEVTNYKNLDINGADIVHEIMAVFVSTVVKTIEENPKAYNSNFIKKVVRNAILTRNRVQNQHQHSDTTKYNSNMETSNILSAYSDDADIFETIPDENSMFKEIVIRLVQKLITDNMDNLTKDQKSVVKSILRNKPFASRYNTPRILAELRHMLAEPAFYMNADPLSDKIGINLDCNTFEDVIMCAELVKSAVVEMPDGTNAVWYGDSSIVYRKYYKVTSYKFIQGKTTYCIPSDQAMNLKVVSVKNIS